MRVAPPAKGFFLRHAVPIGAAIGIGYFTVFITLNRVLPGLVEFHSLHSPVDDWFWFWPEWEYIYFFTVILPFFPVFYIRDRRYFIRVVAYFIFLLSVCYVFFIAFPVRIDRVTPVVTDFITWGVQVNHIADNPINCFPSFHIAIALAIALMVKDISRKTGYGLFALAALISLSVIFVRAHYFWDVVGGAILAPLGYFLVFKRLPSRNRKPELLRRSRYGFAWFLLAFCLTVGIMYVVYVLDLIPLN